MRVLGVAAIWVLATIAAVAWVISQIPKEPVAVQVSAIAAIVQASTALAIVGLTVWLARTSSRAQAAAESARLQALEQARIAQEALGVAQRQADLAEEADRHARRDRQLLETPRINIKNVHHGYGSEMGYQPRGMIVLVRYLNESERPAFNLKVDVWRKVDRHGVTTGLPASGGTTTVEPGFGKEVYDQLIIEIPGFVNVNATTGKTTGGGLLTHPWLAIQIRYEGLLGQKVMEEYSYWADTENELRLFREWIDIKTSVPGAEPFELRF